jgi:phage gpG-like protein
MNEEFLNKLTQIQRTLPEVLRRVPEIARVEGLRFVADNFKSQGFETKTGVYDKWKQKKGRAQKPNLIGEKRGGAMRRSWQGEAEPNRTVFSSNMIYTGVHNDGLRAGRGSGFDMPMRRMIGPSDALDKRIERKLDELMDKTFK